MEPRDGVDLHRVLGRDVDDIPVVAVDGWVKSAAIRASLVPLPTPFGPTNSSKADRWRNGLSSQSIDRIVTRSARMVPGASSAPVVRSGTSLTSSRWTQSLTHLPAASHAWGSLHRQGIGDVGLAR